MSQPEDNLLVTREDGLFFHGVRVERRHIDIASERYEVFALKDAADLLDLPEFGRRFLDDGIAPYGFELWPGAVMLSEWIARGNAGPPSEALEIGCGLALLSIVATRHGWKMSATDNDEHALQFAAINAQLNNVRLHHLGPLDWNHPPADQKFPFIVGSDVLYDADNFNPILRCVDTLLAPDGTTLFADPFRGVADRFPGMAEAAGFKCATLAAMARMDNRRSIDGRIFQLRRQSN
jgi:predicted nicotinamide N-methyase